MLQSNWEEIIRALSVFFLDGEVFEIRALDAMSAGGKRSGTVSGYFDRDHIAAAVDAICKLKEYSGVYVTLNPVKPDLLARACNRIRMIRREPTTSDADVARRAWLLVDCDAVRVSGVSSTDEEHRHTMAKARSIAKELSALGWTQPVVVDSGNGVQMSYCISLPADDGGLVQQVLQQLSRHSDEHTKIDVTVCNDARIRRLPGTVNRKGDDTAERPHRLSRLLSVPNDIEATDESLLRGYVSACNCAPASPQPVIVRDTGRKFDIDEWILQHITCGISGPTAYKDGRKWVLDVCPFNSAHTNRSAVITESADGAIGFRCMHESCTGKDQPRKANLTASVQCNLPEGLMEDFTSGGSIEDALYIQPRILFQKDEFDTLFNVIKSGKDPFAENLLGKLLSIYGASNSVWRLRSRAFKMDDLKKAYDLVQRGEETNHSPVITNPYLVIFGTAIPKFFYESLSPRLLSNGMGARCIILSAGDRTPCNRSKIMTLPKKLRAAVDIMQNYGGGTQPCGIVNMMELPTCPEAEDLLDKVAAKYDERYNKCESYQIIQKAFWAHAMEKVIKLSTLYAVSADVCNPKLTPAAVEWAERFVTFTTVQALSFAEDYSYENRFDEKSRKIIRYIKEAGGWIEHTKLLKRSHESKLTFGKVIETLVESGTISIDWADSSASKKKVYVLREDA